MASRLKEHLGLCCILLQETLLSECLSPPMVECRGVNGYRQTVKKMSQNTGCNLQWASILHRESFHHA